MRKIVMKDPADLRPHDLNKLLYGSPMANEAFKNILFSMKRGGYDERHPLLITVDGRIISGVTRWASAKKAGIGKVPCEVFEPTDLENAELEIEAKLILENGYRTKTRLIVAREQQKLLEIHKRLARARMAHGSDGEASKSVDRVGVEFKVSGKTVQNNMKILGAIDAAHEDGDKRRAEQLTDLLERGSTVKALALINGEERPKKAPKVDVPRTLHDHSNKAHSEFYEACAKVQVQAELDLLERCLEQMRDALATARTRLHLATNANGKP